LRPQETSGHRLRLQLLLALLLPGDGGQGEGWEALLAQPRAADQAAAPAVLPSHQHSARTLLRLQLPPLPPPQLLLLLRCLLGRRRRWWLAQLQLQPAWQLLLSLGAPCRPA
jgi:hypothetical protein